jgi:thiosulfate dehydrogenase [quinone] large subunit
MSTQNASLDVASPSPAVESDGRQTAAVVSALVRLALGWVFLWAFLDKLFGLGRATPADRAWIEGGHPAQGYLKGVSAPDSDNPARGLFEFLAGQGWVDWLFMAALGGIGLGLVLGVALRITAVATVLLMFFLWLSSLPLENNPFVDEHVIYALVSVWLAASLAGDTLGLGRRWRTLPVAASRPALW